MIEAQRNIACYFNVLLLVIAHRYFVGVIQQNVGCLERWVCKETRRDKFSFALLRLVFELCHS